VAASILPVTDGAQWHQRYLALEISLLQRRFEMPGLSSPAATVFERCNLRLIEEAAAHGASRVTLLCLWDGGKGDGPGGTYHMLKEAQRRGFRCIWIDTRRLGQAGTL
jgi:hypothetical protein